jgi:hypothetical protein
MTTKKELKEEFENQKTITVTRRSSQERGRVFERIICDLFEIDGTLITRPYHTEDRSAEQIDGAIEVYNRIILLEIKWVETNLAASDLYAFIGKVENKLDGTLGLFISKEQLSNNFIDSITKGRRRNIILLHGNDIDYLFEEDFILREYLEHAIKLYSYNNTLHLPVEKFRNLVSSKGPVVKPITMTELSIKYIKENITNEKIEPEILMFKLRTLNFNEKKTVLETLLKYYWKYREASDDMFYLPALNKADNAFNTIKILLDEDFAKDTYKEYCSIFIDTRKHHYLVSSIIKHYQPHINRYENSQLFYKTVIDLFNESKGNYGVENILTESYILLWDYFTNEDKKTVLINYIDIYLDNSRKPKYEQKRFADKLFNEDIVPNKKEVIENWIRSVIKSDVTDYKLTNENIERESRIFISRNLKIVSMLAQDNDKQKEFITGLYEEYIKAVNDL